MAYGKRVALKASIANQNQGGGSKKAGFPSQVGRGSWTSIFLGSTDPVSGKCCTHAKIGMNLFPNACQSRPIGAGVAAMPYYHCKGTR